MNLAKRRLGLRGIYYRQDIEIRFGGNRQKRRAVLHCFRARASDRMMESDNDDRFVISCCGLGRLRARDRSGIFDVDYRSESFSKLSALEGRPKAADRVDGAGHGVTVAIRPSQVDCRTALGLQTTMVARLAIGVARGAIAGTFPFMADCLTARFNDFKRSGVLEALDTVNVS
jgi:hypothetical protein